MALVKREEINQADSWDLNPLYSNPEDWKKDLEQAESRLGEVSKFQGKLAESANTVFQALETSHSLSRLAEKLYTYAHLLSDQDTSNPSHLGMVQQAMNFYARLSAACSYMRPEILQLPEETQKNYLSDKELEPYKRTLEDIVRYKKHTLSPNEEKILAMGAEVFGACSKTFSQLNNADLKFDDILIDSKPEPLSHGTYGLHLKNPNREVRKQTHENYYKQFDNHKNTTAATLVGSYQKDVYLSRVRNFNSALESAMFGENIDATVYSNLVDTVSNNLSPLHSYYELRKEKLGLKEQRLFDTYVTLVEDVKVDYPFDKAVDTVCESLTPLGDEYVETLRKGLSEERWADKYENEGKKSGAYSSGCYDSPPYMLLNHNASDIRDIYTLTHEAGHSMHSYYSRKHQSYQDSGYTIFVAEVASTFNEQLLTRHLRKEHQNDAKMQSYLVNNQIDDIKSTLYRQTMFAEFEKQAHEVLENNQPLTVEVFTDIYGKLLVKYFGNSVVFEDIDKLEYSRIPHFYSAFYVYKYSTGIAAAIALSRRVLEGGKSELDDYLKFLTMGSSKYSLELLADAGVDMRKKEPIETACQVFAGLVDELKSLI